MRESSFIDLVDIVTLLSTCHSNRCVKIICRSKQKNQKSLRFTISEQCVLTAVVQKESDSGKNSFLHPFSTLSHALNPQKYAFLKEPELFSSAGLYNSNIDGLDDHLHQFSRTSDRKIQTGMQWCSSRAELVQLKRSFCRWSQWTLLLLSGGFLHQRWWQRTSDPPWMMMDYTTLYPKKGNRVVALRNFNSLMMALAGALLVFLFSFWWNRIDFLVFVSVKSSCEWDFKNLKQTRRRSICFP